jgi:serine/threonine protein kinase
MDYMPGGTMFHKVMYQKEVLSEELAGFYAAELALAVEYLHKQGIVHR